MVDKTVDKTEDELVEAIESLADRITGDVKACDALQFTQAALNAAHIIQVLRQANSV